MKYLIFDIECAGQNKPYSFGYCLCDEELNVIQTEDIVMNPNVKTWDWYVVKHMLAYPKKYVESQPTFPTFYNRIKELLTNKDHIVCGFSVKDDIGYICGDCKRYGLEPIEFNFVDIQRLHTKLRREIGKGLSPAYLEWIGKEPINMHRSDIDAKYTLEIADAICKKEGKSLIDVINDYKECTGTIEGWKYSFVNEKNKTEYGEPRGKDGKFRKVKEGEENHMPKGSKNALLFLRMIESAERNKEREQILKGKSISLSLNYEINNFKEMMFLVQRIHALGGTYVKKATTADIFVKEKECENIENQRCSKYEYVKEEIENGKKIEVMEFNEFLSLIGLTQEDVENVPETDYEYLMDEKYCRRKQYEVK